MAVLTRLVPFTHEVPVELHRPEDADGSLLVALQGWGMSASSFAKDVGPLLPQGMSALIPQAPLPFELRSADGIRQGNAWYIYTGGDDADAFLASMRRAEDWVLRLVDAVTADHGYDAARLALLGYSQGGYLAGWTGLRHAARFRRLVVAAARIKHEVLEEDARRAASTPLRVLAVHGDADDDVAASRSRTSVEALAAWGVAAEFREYRFGHGVIRDERCREDVTRFLAT
jgi:phospholipase/carboxylesterase